MVRKLLNPYKAIILAQLKVFLHFRSAIFAGLATQVFWGMIKVMILKAFYTQSSFVSKGTLSFMDATIFIWLGQAFLHLVPWSVDKDIAKQIRSGNIAYELLRPISLYWSFYARSLSFRLFSTLLRATPLFLIAVIFFNLPLPRNIESFSYFSLSLVLSGLLSSAITSLVMSSLFWTLSGEGIQRLLPHFVMFSSGMVVPLPLFPDSIRSFFELLPFRGVIDIPCRLYAGGLSTSEILYFLEFQITWILILILIGQWVMANAQKRLVIQGG